MIYGEEQNTDMGTEMGEMSYYKYEEPKRTKNRTRFTIEPKLGKKKSNSIREYKKGSIASAKDSQKKRVVDSVKSGRKERGKLVKKRRGFGNRIMAPKGVRPKYIWKKYIWKHGFGANGC